MIFYNYSDKELRIMNNTMNAFCNGLWNIDYQNIFSHNKQFLENILNKISIVLDTRRLFEYSNLDDRIISHNFNMQEIKMVVKMLQDFSEYMRDISHNGKADIASCQFKLTQKKLEELLSLMPSGDLSGDEVVLMNYFLNELFQDLRFISLKTQDQKLLENVLYDIQKILENKLIFSTWDTDDLLSRLSLDQEQTIVLIKALKILPRYFQDWDIDTRIGGSFLEIDILIHEIEYSLFIIKFNVILDDDLNVIYNIINELVYESTDVDYQSAFACDKQFLENMLSKIMVILDNRIFFKKWGDFNPLESSSLDSIEMNVIIKMLEIKNQSFKDEEFHTKFGCSAQEIQELKNRLESLLFSVSSKH